MPDERLRGAALLSLLVFLRRGTVSAAKFVGRMLGIGLKAPSENAKPVIRETATLFSIVLAAGAGLIIGQIDTNRPIWPFVVAFDLIAFACCLFGMVVMIMAKDSNGGHLYDWASIRYTQVAALATLAVAGVLTGLALAGELPWQTFAVQTQAPLGQPYRDTFADKTDGLVVPVKLDRSVFPRGVPPKLLMSVTLRDDIGKGWYAEDVDGAIGSPSESLPMKPEPIEYKVEKPRPNQTVWYLNELKDDKVYTLRVYLHRKGEKADLDFLRKAVQDKGLTVMFHSKEKSSKQK